MRVGVVFPGPGLAGRRHGLRRCRALAARRARLFDRAAAVLGYDLLALQRDGPEERLRETRVQPAGDLYDEPRALRGGGDADLQPVVTRGPFVRRALQSGRRAIRLSFEDALRIVSERGKAMQAAAQLARGGMSAVLGLEADAGARGLSRERADRGRVALANFNSPTQIVISGDYDAVQAAGQAMLDAGAKRVVPLNVSGAWHSELMEPAVERSARRRRSEPVCAARSSTSSPTSTGGPTATSQRSSANLIRSVGRRSALARHRGAMLSYRAGHGRRVRRERRAERA